MKAFLVLFLLAAPAHAFEASGKADDFSAAENAKSYLRFKLNTKKLGLFKSEVTGFVRKFMDFTSNHPPLQSIATHPRLLETVSRLLGDSPHLLQEMAMIKPPTILPSSMATNVPISTMPLPPVSSRSLNVCGR